MTAKSIVDIEVNSAQFHDFFALFQEYQSKLESMPEDWKDAGEAMDDASGAMEALLDLSGKNADAVTIAAYQANVISKEIRAASASNNALIESLKTGTKAQKGFADETERGNKAMVSMKKNADSVAKSIFGIGKFMLKLGAIGGGFAGLGGILGALSLKDLAESAVDTQRNARGLGMTPGQLTAFHQDLGNYVDPSILGNVANAQGNFTGRMWLSRASGIGMDQVAGMDPGQLSGQLALKAHDWWVNTPAAMRTSEVYQSSGLAQSGVPFEMARQDGNTPRADILQGNSQYGVDQGRFNVPDQNSKAWYDFLRQITDTGNTIETDLKNKLVALSPDLQHFIDVLGKDAKELIDHVLTPENLKKAGDAINDFTHWLESDKLRHAIDDTAALFGKLGDAFRALGLIPDRPDHDTIDPSEERRESHGQFGAPSSSASGVDVAKHPFGTITHGSAISPLWQGVKNLWNYDWHHPFGRITSNNPGNLRAAPGAPTVGGFAQFANADDGLKAMAWTLSRYPTKHHADTLASIIGTYAPSSENDTAAYIKNASQWTGFDPKQHLNLNDPTVMSKLVSAMLRQESGKKVSPKEVLNDIQRSQWNAPSSPDFNKLLAALRQSKNANVNLTLQNSTAARVSVQANAAAIQ